jgi:hypothetical protein
MRVQVVYVNGIDNSEILLQPRIDLRCIVGLIFYAVVLFLGLFVFRSSGSDGSAGS